MNESDRLLAAAPVPKAFFKLAVPAVAAQLINILYNLVDKMFIGHIPAVGKQALAGVGVTTPVILAISAFAALVSMGGAPKASILLGKGETEQAEKVVGSCTWMLLLLSILLTGIMLAFGRAILLLFGASNDTISFAADYMNIYCLGTLFTQLTLGLNAFITAQGKTLVSIYLAVLLIYGVQVACQYSFVALDQAPKAIFLTIWRKIILLIPLIFLLPHLWPNAVTGVYLAEPIADTIAVCTTAPMFYAYYRKLK